MTTLWEHLKLLNGDYKIRILKDGLVVEGRVSQVREIISCSYLLECGVKCYGYNDALHKMVYIV